MTRSGTEQGNKTMLEVTRIVHFVLLLVGVSCVAQTSGLECPYSDPKCACRQDDVTCSMLEELHPVRTGSEVYNVTIVYLQGDGINNLSKENLPPGLQILFLSLDPLTNISDDAFDSSATTLERLVIDNAKFTQLPQALLKLTSLTDLRLTDIPIDQWQDSILHHIAPKITDLTFSYVNLHGWPSWLSYFYSLKNLDFSGNLLSNIPDNAFQAFADRLQSLNLGRASLTEMPQAFSSLSSLSSLYLSENSLSEVEVEKLNSFPLAESLLTLSINSIALTRFPNISRLTQLGTLVMNGNKISDPNTGSFSQSLSILQIAENSLSSVPNSVANLSNLYSLYLEMNEITDIKPLSFPLGLAILSMSRNKLTTITNTTFTNLKRLRSLYLEYNPISVIETGAFSDLVSLETLSLTFTDLTEISPAFMSLRNHVRIDISSLKTFSCPCPTPPELVTWYQSLTFKAITTTQCSNGQSVTSYLSGQCNQPLI